MTDGLELIILIGLRRPFKRARPYQAEHRTVFEPIIIRLTEQALLAKVIGSREIALVETVNDPITHAGRPRQWQRNAHWLIGQGGVRRAIGSIMTRVAWFPASWDALMKSANS